MNIQIYIYVKNIMAQLFFNFVKMVNLPGVNSTKVFERLFVQTPFKI
jgi:hypothetical protein